MINEDYAQHGTSPKFSLPFMKTEDIKSLYPYQFFKLVEKSDFPALICNYSLQSTIANVPDEVRQQMSNMSGADFK